MGVSATLRYAVIGGVALGVGAAGVLGLRYVQGMSSHGPPALPAGPPPPAAIAPAAGAVTAGAPEVPQLKFPPFVQRYSLAQDGAAYYAPNLNGPILYPLKTGTPLVSAAKSDDGSWIIAMTEDGQAAYLPVSELGPYDAAASPLGPPPETVSGPAQVIDTATLSVNGQSVSLTGVKGVGGATGEKLQEGLADHGSTVTCVPEGVTYRCTLPDGVDVARLALFNGLAQPADDASQDYQQQSAAAQAGHRGIWQ